MRARSLAVFFIVIAQSLAGMTSVRASEWPIAQPDALGTCPDRFLGQPNATYTSQDWHDDPGFHLHCNAAGQSRPDFYANARLPTLGLDAIYYDPTPYGSTGTYDCTRLYVHYNPVTRGGVSGEWYPSGVRFYTKGTDGGRGQDFVVHRPNSIAESAAGWAMYRITHSTANAGGAGGHSTGGVYGVDVNVDEGRKDGGLISWTIGAPLTPAGLAPLGASGILVAPVDSAHYSGTCCSYNQATECAPTPGSQSQITAAIGDYVYALKVTHPPLLIGISWRWHKTWSGTWDLKNSAGDRLRLLDPTGADIGEAAGNGGAAGAQVDTSTTACGYLAVFPCLGPFTLTITDSSANARLTYVIPEDAMGTLIEDVSRPKIGGIRACYNATPGQCGAGQLQGTATLTYSFGPSGVVAHVTAGPQYPYGPGIDTPAPYDAPDIPAGTYTISGLVVDTTKSSRWELIVSGLSGTDATTFELDFVNGGSVQVKVPDVVAECGPLDVACAVRWLASFLVDRLTTVIQEALTAVFMPSQKSWTAFAALGEKVKVKPPVAQFYAAREALDSATRQGGGGSVCWTFDLHIGVNGALAPVCLDPLGARPEWGAVRALLGAGVVLGCAGYYVKELSPRPVVTG